MPEHIEIHSRELYESFYKRLPLVYTILPMTVFKTASDKTKTNNYISKKRFIIYWL